MWGIGGSAAATLIAYSVYFSLTMLFIWFKLKVSLFSTGMLKVLLMMAALWVGADVWEHFVSPLIQNFIVDAVIKTGLLSAIALAATYFWRISPAINDIIDRIVRKVK